MSFVKTISVSAPTEDRAAPVEKGEDTFLLAHLSDPHLSSVTGMCPAMLLSKRLPGYLSWCRRRRIHRTEVLEALLQDLSETDPDRIAVTGDLTHLGLPDEFRQAAHWLARLGPAEQVMVVPGNHDAYVPAAWEQSRDLWAPYLAGEEPGGDDAYPRLRVCGSAALIGLSSARPSAPFLAVGSLGKTQLMKLDQLLEQTRRRGLVRIILLHHPPVAGSVAWRKRLTDAPLFAEVLERRGAELILHGHAHVPFCGFLPADGQKIPVFGVPSASDGRNKPRRVSRYHLYRLRCENGAWKLRLTVRRYYPDAKRFATLQTEDILLPFFSC